MVTMLARHIIAAPSPEILNPDIITLHEEIHPSFHVQLITELGYINNRF
jgi:hypothetical protein